MIDRVFASLELRCKRYNVLLENSSGEAAD